MATNPMQKKARNSFLLGMLLMLVISAAIIGVLLVLLSNAKQEQEEKEAETVEIYVLGTSVKSGQIITTDMLKEITVSAEMAPINAIQDTADFMNYSLVEKNTGSTLRTDQEGLYYVNENNAKVRVEQDGDYYYTVINNSMVAVEFREVPLVAKVNMNENTPLTLQMVARSDEAVSDDLRVVDLSMIMLPIDLEVDDYIDIRLQTPDGQNYIVVAKKRIIDVQENTIWIKMTEDEISMLSNAVVEAYIIKASKLYANVYAEPGLQNDATPTYPPSKIVVEKMLADPNILQEAKVALTNRYNDSQVNIRNNNINEELNKYVDDALKNIEDKLKEESETRKELRNKFLEGLTTENVE